MKEEKFNLRKKKNNNKWTIREEEVAKNVRGKSKKRNSL